MVHQMHFVHLTNHLCFILFKFLCLVQSVNIKFLLMMTQCLINKLSKCANVRLQKNHVFLQFYHYLTITNKKIQHTIFETFTKKNLTRFQVGFFNLQILEIFKAAFFVKSYSLNFFLKYCRLLSLKIKKSSQERCKPHKNCLTQQETRKTLNKRKSQTTTRKSPQPQ